MTFNVLNVLELTSQIHRSHDLSAFECWLWDLNNRQQCLLINIASHLPQLKTFKLVPSILICFRYQVINFFLLNSFLTDVLWLFSFSVFVSMFCLCYSAFMVICMIWYVFAPTLTNRKVSVLNQMTNEWGIVYIYFDMTPGTFKSTLTQSVTLPFS